METREMFFDLRLDVSKNAGYTIPGEYEKRYYGPKDTAIILECISQKMQDSKEPEELVKFDIIIYGMITPAVFGRMAANLQAWDTVATLTYIRPGDGPVLIFPMSEEDLSIE